MKRTALALGMVLAAAAATAADVAVSDLDKAWTKAMLANDLAAVVALYAPDALMYPPDAMELKGREAIQKGYADFLGSMKCLEAKLTPAGNETHGDTQIGWGRWTLRMGPKAGGDPVLMEGRYMAVARKITGKWLYVADHASAPLPPPPAAATK
jgi:uncharacterized protein (TIGR02246 family)